MLDPYFARRHEFTVQQDCVLWGIRVIVPPKLQRTVLQELHEGHIGVVKMKSLARSYIWWPGLDKEIEQCAKSCVGCGQHQHNPSKAPLHPWIWPSKPWQRIHIDFAGPFQNAMYLVVVDAHSKWPEVKIMSTTTSDNTITELREIFSRNGIPDQIVSDNGPQFRSTEFQDFTRSNGIKHIFSSPYQPSTNGLAERFVQTLKQSLRAAQSGNLHHKLANFLLAYRNTPHQTTKMSPAAMLNGRILQTRLSLVKPSIGANVTRSQLSQSDYRGGKEREFQVGDHVLARDYRKGCKWQHGTVTARTGPVSYTVGMDNGLIQRRHTDQLIATSQDLQADMKATVQPVIQPTLPNPVVSVSNDNIGTSCVEVTDQSDNVKVTEQDVPSCVVTKSQSEVINAKPATPKINIETNVRPVRIRKAPQRLDL